jgi:hypothetical protein
VTISAQVTVNTDILAPVKVILKIIFLNDEIESLIELHKAKVLAKKKMAFAWVEIPCWQQQFGSCTFDDACTLSPYQEICPQFFEDHKIPCHCPVTQVSLNILEIKVSFATLNFLGILRVEKRDG